MKAVYAAIVMISAMSFVAGREQWQASIALPIAATSAEITAQPLPAGGEVVNSPSVERRDSEDPRVDLLGNEIEDAIADYRIDHGGGVYERHSPETALARLGCPST